MTQHSKGIDVKGRTLRTTNGHRVAQDRSRGVFALMALLCASQMFYYFGWPLRPDRLLWFCFLVTVTLDFVRGRLTRPPFRLLEAVMACFSAWVIVSLLFALGPGGVETSTRINEALNLAVYPFALFLVAQQLKYDSVNAKSFVSFLAWVGLYLSVTAIAERFRIEFLIWPRYIVDASVGIHFGRARGPFVDAVLMGLNQTVCLVAVFVSLQWENGLIRRVVLMLSVPLLLLGIYLTGTRGPWVALAVSLASTIAIRTKLRRSALVCVALIAFAFVFAGASKFSLTSGTLFSRRQNTVDDRVVNYRVAFLMGMDNLAHGVGFSEMGEHFMHYYDLAGRPSFGGWDGNHNEYLGLFAETGLPALLLFVAVLVLTIFRCVNAIRHAQDESARLLGVLALCAVLGLTVIGMFNQIRSAAYHICIAYFLAGMAATVTRVKKSNPQTQRNDSRRVTTRTLHRRVAKLREASLR